ncbi:hypothetical protein AURDEDRAFT_26210, partial [Auricularia subglabra TFB-10046 SS5]
VKRRPGVLNERRADYFKGHTAVKALMLPQFDKIKGAPTVATEDDAVAVLRSLLPHGFYLQVERRNGKPKPLKLMSAQQFSPDGHYVWLYEGPRWKTYVTGAAILLVILVGSTFQAWPDRCKELVAYALCTPIVFYAFVGVLAVLSQVLFAITSRVVAPGIWLFPNLLEDCSVLQSFVPVWAWHQPGAVAQTKRKR